MPFAMTMHSKYTDSTANPSLQLDWRLQYLVLKDQAEANLLRCCIVNGGMESASNRLKYTVRRRIPCL